MIPVRSSAAGRWPCRTFSMPSGVTGMCVPSSIFSASSRAVISSRPLPLTIRRSHAGERRAPASRSGRAGRASPSITRVQVAASAALGDRGEGEQRRDVADGVAPRGVVERRARRRCPRVGARRRFAVMGIVRAPLARGRQRGERRRGLALVRDGDADAARPAGRARPRRRRAARAPSSAAPAIAACSLVPQPTITTGPPSRIDSAASTAADEARIGSTSPGSARIISSMAHGGPSRSSGMSLMAEDGTVRVALSDRATSMPVNRATLELFAPLDRASRDAPARPARGRDLRRDHRRRRPAGHPPARLARARRDARRLPRRGERGLRADRRRGLDRGPPRRRAGRPRGAGGSRGSRPADGAAAVAPG